MENCKARSRRDEASTAGTEKAFIQRGAASVTVIVLVAFAVDIELAAMVDMVVDKHAFLAGCSLEAPAQQQ